MIAGPVDPAEAAAFDADGYVVRPLLTAGDVATLLALFESLPVVHGTGFTAALAQLDHDENRRVSAAIEAVLLPRLEDVVQGFRPIGATFLVKGSGDEGAMVVHQDWNSVDERVTQSVNVWCPLADVGTTDGPLEVIAGSHRWFGSFRSPLLPSVLVPFGPEVDAALTPLPVAAGAAIIYSHALLHGSRQNRSSRSRIVVQLGLAPIAEPLVMCFPGPGEAVELRAVEQDAFFRGFEFEEAAPETFPGQVLATLPPAPLTEEDVLVELRRRAVLAQAAPAARRPEGIVARLRRRWPRLSG